MNKRGQIFILTAIILASVIFILSVKSNVVQQVFLEDDFKILSSNYEVESSKFINSLINTDKNISANFFNFTLLFTSYSKARNPDFGLIYAFGLEGEISIGNFLAEEIIVNADSIDYLINGCYDDISAVITFQGLSLSSEVNIKDIEQCLLAIPFVDTIWIGIDGLWYRFDIIEDNPQIMIVSREESIGQRQVFIGGEGFRERDNDKTVGEFCENFQNQISCEDHESCCWGSSGSSGECRAC